MRNEDQGSKLHLEGWTVWKWGGQSGRTWHQLICECGYVISQGQWTQNQNMRCVDCDKEVPTHIIGFLWLCTSDIGSITS